ncbi:hypothetical protein RIF29_26275 [Crotalaria pallida]|uniref:Uncharacterized protein n=1 Tax=Crotalaria pallida TaxID=3830 RepID=A0AAN9EPS0_CROPI
MADLFIRTRPHSQSQTPLHIPALILVASLLVYTLQFYMVLLGSMADLVIQTPPHSPSQTPPHHIPAPISIASIPPPLLVVSSRLTMMNFLSWKQFAKSVLRDHSLP